MSVCIGAPHRLVRELLHNAAAFCAKLEDEEEKAVHQKNLSLITLNAAKTATFMLELEALGEFEDGGFVEVDESSDIAKIFSSVHNTELVEMTALRQAVREGADVSAVCIPATTCCCHAGASVRTSRVLSLSVTSSRLPRRST